MEFKAIECSKINYENVYENIYKPRFLKSKLMKGSSSTHSFLLVHIQHKSRGKVELKEAISNRKMCNVSRTLLWLYQTLRLSRCIKT